MLGWELAPHNSGGLGVACLQLCRALAKQGADIEFILPYAADHALDFMQITAEQPQGVAEIALEGSAYDSRKYVYADGHTEWHDLYAQVHMYEHAVGDLLPDKAVDVIHAHDWLTFRAGIRAKQATGAPLILHVHSIERDRAGGSHGNPLVREIESLAFMLADRIITVSQHTKNMIIKDYGIPADKLEVVHNSIDADSLEPLDTSNAYRYLDAMRARGYKVITLVSRLTLQKGLTTFLHAAQEVVRREPKVFFLIVGSGDQYFELVRLAADLGLARHVLFAGFQRGKRWRDAYAVADLFVLPSVSEPFGLTALEAVGYGAPVLLTKQSGVAEVLHHVLKVDFWDVERMADQIVSAVQNESLRAELRNNAYREFSRLSWAKAASQLLDIYGRHISPREQHAGAAV